MAGDELSMHVLAALVIRTLNRLRLLLVDAGCKWSSHITSEVKVSVTMVAPARVLATSTQIKSGEDRHGRGPLSVVWPTSYQVRPCIGRVLDPAVAVGRLLGYGT